MRVPYFLLHRIPNMYTVHESAVRLGPQPAYPFAPRNHSRSIFGNAESSLVPPFRSSPGTTSNTSEGATPACSCTGRPEPQRQRAGRSGPAPPHDRTGPGGSGPAPPHPPDADGGPPGHRPSAVAAASHGSCNLILATPTYRAGRRARAARARRPTRPRTIGPGRDVGRRKTGCAVMKTRIRRTFPLIRARRPRGRVRSRRACADAPAAPPRLYTPVRCVRNRTKRVPYARVTCMDHHHGKG